MDKKILKLIYKKLDNTISDKELKKLNIKLENNEELKNEYLLICNIQNELKNSDEVPLPENFKSQLRYKLTQITQENTVAVSRKNFFCPAAGAIAAVFIVVFALNSQPDKLTNIVVQETTKEADSENLDKSRMIIPDSTSEYNVTCDEQKISAAKTAKNESADFAAYNENIITI